MRVALPELYRRLEVARAQEAYAHETLAMAEGLWDYLLTFRWIRWWRGWHEVGARLATWERWRYEDSAPISDGSPPVATLDKSRPEG